LPAWCEQPEHFPIEGREDHCDQRAGIFERLARVGQFDLLKPVHRGIS
jgi:hypothetical protein